MLDTNDPLVQMKITESVCAFVAISSTAHRLYIRRGRWWIDDVWAAFSLLTLFAQIAAVFLHVKNPQTMSKLSQVAAYYLMAITFYTVIWGSRISIIYSVIRIDSSRSRRMLYVAISVVYFLAALIMIIQLFWVCEPMPSWKEARNPQCPLTTQVAVAQLVTDILADLFLLVAPLTVLKHLQDKALRKKLIMIFSTCLVTTVVSLVHATFILTTGGIKVIISALVEDCISLIVCNLPVVVTSLLRFADQDRKPPATPSMITHSLQFAGQKLGISKQSTTFDTSIGSDSMHTVKVTRTVEISSSPIMLDLLDHSRSGEHAKGDEEECH
ncbi:hypothetical protein BDP27DRAFT_1254160 [Rhodocollybia butyracea]|uniref:Rhodopsin domain-containing protein n=1 Tax=Rhodocollybia butyracea TaxID=206335 RepID=A0A9P5UFE0_9AGAR|nr:hypothetical protein BDP27DRAFT_1254160 [Rhodocollybia butyracea]